MLARTGILKRGLDAILFKVKNRAALLGQLMSLTTGRLGPRAVRGVDVKMLRCSRVTIEADHGVPTQIDGDLFGITPFEVHAGTAGLRLIVPRHR